MDASLSVPPHLRQYVVTQDYAAYTEEDQAVWRFVLLQTFERLTRTAHAAYASGLSAAGLSVDRIPRIAHMSERLSEHGFGAVCVDGFIPPRAFSAFQANGFLPIAADIRTSKHLAYTPAPDIIHEAAGHAPFLAHPAYASYLRRIGAVSERAFSDAYDRELYQAVYLLSEVKEDPASTPAQIAAAEAQLEALTHRATAPSEAALLARLYWWTVEYGLVGTLEDFRLYGAGLLSSLGEGHFCHEERVTKLPLTAACIEMAYDITRPQPQLYVARDFEQLERVLEDVEATLSYRRGGMPALRAALASGEPATFELGDDVQLAGVLSHIEADGWLELAGPCALAFEHAIRPGWPRAERYVLPLGATTDGRALGELGPDALRRYTHDGWLELQTRAGVHVRGRPLDVTFRAGRARAVLLAEFELRARGQLLLRSTEPYPLALATEAVTASADLPDGFHAQTEFAAKRVPKPRQFDAAQRRLIELYEQTRELLRAGCGGGVVGRFEKIYAELEVGYPDEWLLRWNLLEGLVKLGEKASLGERIAQQLEGMELRFAHREPIATGLAYLRSQ
ncbi:MAG TPA: aromatic amino acid hydroxylase [Polyangiales bacterium]|nr:aromatic amino acid hydroxylase [Polyangiales bacterium]